MKLYEEIQKLSSYNNYQLLQADDALEKLEITKEFWASAISGKLEIVFS